MDANYVKDSYHSLFIEGYRVTEGLIEGVRSGQWNPENTDDADRRNVLAARGYSLWKGEMNIWLHWKRQVWKEI